jgi:hypothetical protein
MELPVLRRGFSLDALIAEAKRRAQHRRLLIVLLLVVVGAVAAVVTFGSPGGGSRASGVPGKTGGRSPGSRSAHIGPFAVSVPRGFHSVGTLPGDTASLTISNVISPLAPNRVELDIGYVGSAIGPLFRTSQLPLDVHKLHAVEPGRHWTGLVSVGGSIYGVTLFVGRKAPAAARASVLHALSSIHRTH